MPRIDPNSDCCHWCRTKKGPYRDSFETCVECGLPNQKGCWIKGHHDELLKKLRDKQQESYITNDCKHTFVKVGQWDNGVVTEVCSKCRVGKGMFPDSPPEKVYQPTPGSSPSHVEYKERQ